MEQTERKSSSGIWLMVGVAGAAVSAMVVGGIMTARLLGDTAGDTVLEKTPEPPKPQAALQEAVEKLPPAVHERKHPKTFGLPAYPSAFEFHSMQVGKEIGSVSFLVKKGTSRQISQYYIEKMGTDGWQFLWDQRVPPMRPGDGKTGPAMPGLRLRWIKGKKQLTLLSLDDPQKGRTAQVALSWAPRLPSASAAAKPAGN